jgi:hypothetical protein
VSRAEDPDVHALSLDGEDPDVHALSLDGEDPHLTRSVACVWVHLPLCCHPIERLQEIVLFASTCADIGA